MNVPTNAFSRPYVYPLIFSIVSVLGSYCLWLLDLNFWNADDILTGIATATFASYITIILVDRSFRDQEIERRQRMQNTALRQIRIDINRHLTLLTNMYIAASIESRKNPPNSYCEFFDDDFISTIQYLDFSKEYPTARDSTTVRWFDHAESRLREFQESIDQVIAQHSVWLDPQFVQLLNDLKTSTFITIIITTSEVDLIQVDRELGYERNYAILLGHKDIISEHTSLLLELIEKYHELEETELANIEKKGVWNGNSTPSVGSARLPIKLNETDQSVEE